MIKLTDTERDRLERIRVRGRSIYEPVIRDLEDRGYLKVVGLVDARADNGPMLIRLTEAGETVLSLLAELEGG